jgi:hypothetical protein
MNISEFSVENSQPLTSYSEETKHNETITSESLSDTKRLIKTSLLNQDTKNIKNINEDFGELKKSEKSLKAVKVLFEENRVEEVIPLMQKSLYKEQNLFESIRIARTDTARVNLYLEVKLLLSQNDTVWALELIDKQLEVTTSLLKEVKKELLSQSANMGSRLGSKLGEVKQEINALTKSQEAIDVDQLKNRFKSLF